VLDLVLMYSVTGTAWAAVVTITFTLPVAELVDFEN
jgi:hypothetical protein